VLALAAVLLAVWAVVRPTPSTGTPLRGDKVVLVGIPHFGLDDLRDGPVPNLRRLAERGALSAMNVRTVSGHPSTAEAYASLGAANRVKATTEAGTAYDAKTPVDGQTAGQALGDRTGARPRTGVVSLDIAGLRDRARRDHLATRPGALGDALRRRGVRTAVLGNADLGADLDQAPERPIALALTDQRGRVPRGTVSPALLTPDVAAPYGVTGAPGMADRVVRQLRTADVVAVDTGDLDRAGALARISPPDAGEAARRRSLAATDRFVGELADRLPRDALLLVAGVTPPGDEWALTPLIAVGPTTRHGSIVSQATKRPGLVTLTEIAPTIIRALGHRPPSIMGDVRLTVGDPVALDSLARLDHDARARQAVWLPVVVIYVIVQCLFYFAAIAVGRFRRLAPLAPWLRAAVVAVAALPIATYAWRFLSLNAHHDGGVPGLLVLTALLAAAAMGDRRHPLAPLWWLLGATVAVTVVDIATGAHLQPASILGYAPQSASRYFGLSNTALAVLATATVLFAAIHLVLRRDRGRALAEVAALYALVLVAAAAPSIGSDVGALLTLVPLLGASFWIYSGRRASWRLVAGVAVAVPVALGIVAAVDANLPANRRTHLGRLVDEVRHDGLGPLGDVVARKVDTTMRLIAISGWTEVILVIAALGIYLVAYEGRFERVLPPDSPLRPGIALALAGGLLAVVVNDSGAVMTALVFVYVGPVVSVILCAAPGLTAPERAP
jgi:hypothetical protein